MPKASNLKKGAIVAINQLPYQVKQVEVHTPSARGANTLYKVRFNCVSTGQKLDQSYKGNDFLEDVDLEKRSASFLYSDQSLYTFMDSENYEQYTLSAEILEGQTQWLMDGMEGIVVFVFNGFPLCIEIPDTMDLAITETAPGMKAASATSRNKPAVLFNGVTVLVPEYLTQGEIIKVNTETGKYMSRAKA
ncbi:MAG: elongation factor P-like protein YeiP [Proteobacteria bacterium]|nr:elongation factor P-like protein YeiP [Pseudomonadota bacterium]MBU4471854.1 elongation factor P-like protein YeiP [Pseudomonadota bacterium]MCG2750634.1 elongation factor P-like protein YeiP [Desulfobacteraceae bacterium]